MLLGLTHLDVYFKMKAVRSLYHSQFTEVQVIDLSWLSVVILVIISKCYMSQIWLSIFVICHF